MIPTLDLRTYIGSCDSRSLNTNKTTLPPPRVLSMLSLVRHPQSVPYCTNFPSTVKAMATKTVSIACPTASALSSTDSIWIQVQNIERKPEYPFGGQREGRGPFPWRLLACSLDAIQKKCVPRGEERAVERLTRQSLKGFLEKSNAIEY